jgi:hypothetical protein
VDMKALLKFLSDRKFSGSVMIRAAGGTGVIILSEGDLAGAYTSESRDISDKPDRALALCDDPSAMIEVKSANTVKHPPLDVDEVVASQRGPRIASAPPAAAAPPPPPPAPEPITSPMPVIPEPTAATAAYPTYTSATVTHPTPPSVPAMQVAPTTPPAASGSQRDWSPVVAELQAMAEDALGNRARKVKDILGAADPSMGGIEAAIDQVPSISLLFVDSSRLESLAHEMRARLKSHL